MANMISTLSSNVVPGQYNLADTGKSGVVLSEVTTFTLIQLAAWPEAVASVGKTAAGSAGTPRASGPGEIRFGKNAGLLRVEPLKWWLISEGENSVGMPTLDSENGCVLDISHSRVWVKLGGDKACDLLNRFLPIDLRDNEFPSGSVATTAFHHTGVTLWREDVAYNLLLPRSFAVSLWELLVDSAKQFGCEIK